ncbi:triple tyrosine motif-containing protein [Lewinella sp. 4G2]|uniref:sensor histidine kinase n=1 Tax=Lewinella sp. 4G2 TaxID=1803372 RepID=UPI0007B4BEB7|nr:triple tyrosine motif-containing protein [Lewinella sp. 4G2]OAV46241.1 hypothetical protein A3850_018470 [Lewinella sp. 4G2]
MLRPLLLLLLASCCLPNIGIAQQLRIEYFTVNDGLSEREINDFYISEDGFLWVATMDGLNRFDGQRFTRFGVGPAEDQQLSEGAISNISLDNEGWFVLTPGGFYGYFDRFNPVTKEVRQVALVPSTGVLGYPRAITTDALGRVFVVTIGSEGTFIYEYTPYVQDPARQFTPIFHEPNDAWTTLAPRVELLPLTNGQFVLYDEEHGFRHLSATGEILSTPFESTAGQRRFYFFAEAADGGVYFSFRDGYPLFNWQPGGDQPPFPVSQLDDGLRYPAVSHDEKGQLLIQATEDILGDAFPSEYYLVDTTGDFTLFEKSLPTGRAVTAATALDFNETVYLGLREGLGVIERYSNSVRTFLTTRAEDKLGQNTLHGICEDDNGTVYVIEKEGHIYAFPAGAEQPDTLQITLAADTTELLNFRAGYGLLYDPEYNALWATAKSADRKKGGILIQVDLATLRAQVFPSLYPLGALAQDARGKTYIAASDASEVGMLLEFNETTNLFTVVEAKGEDAPKPISGFAIESLTRAAKGELLLGTADRGLLRFEPETRNLTYLTSSPEEVALGAFSEPITSILELNNVYYLATTSGLKTYGLDGKSLKDYSRVDGLSSNQIVGITPDTSGGLWLSSNNGLTHLTRSFNPDDFRRFYREDGLAGDVFTPLSHHRATDGRFFFGGTNGLTVFREGDFSTQAYEGRVMITEVTVYGRNDVRIINTNLDELRQVTVFAAEKSVAISFALPAGHLPSSTQFRYRLEGFNDDWVPLTNERTIRFNNLGSGKYTLRIQGAGANGNFGTEETTLRINVRQYLYEKLWFQALVLFCFASLVLVILQSKLKERLRNEQLRTQLSSDIHDEVSGLLAGITLQAELLKGRTEDEVMQGKLDRVGEAGRTALSKMSDVIWSIDSRRDTIGNLLQRMQEHADEVLLPIEIRYQFKAVGLDEENELSGNIRQDLYFIYKEAINNIARHSNATHVDIELTQTANQFQLFIRDNGEKKEETPDPLPGTSDSAQQRQRVRREKTGQGRDNMKMRAARLGGEISIDDRFGYTLVFRMKRL